MLAGNNPAGSNWSHLPPKETARGEPRLLRHDLEAVTTSTVRRIVVAPVIEGHAMRVRLVASMETELIGTRIEAIHSGTAVGIRRSPGLLDAVPVVNATLIEQTAVWSHHYIIGRMVRICTVQPLHDDLPNVRLVVTVRVLQKENVRLRNNDHTTIPEGETSRIVNFGEFNDSVSDTVSIVVWQDQQRIVHFLEWLPLRVGRPDSRPQTSLRADAELHRVDDLRKAFFVSKKIGSKTIARFQHAQCFRRLVVAEGSFLVGTAALGVASDIRLHR